MKTAILQFNDTGICVVDVEKVCEIWSDKMGVFQYGEKFTLAKIGRNGTDMKVRVSEEQAQEIISKAKLLPIKDSLFRNATSYKKEDFIRAEIKRCSDLLQQKEAECRVLYSTILEFNKALSL